ncbi:MAG: hypothetical protein H3C47_16655 [Candidatus Cloacimonetes bacterium]|nr:hypothetical protein [Candidatus Cloacimonadota bacterium]
MGRKITSENAPLKLAELKNELKAFREQKNRTRLLPELFWKEAVDLCKFLPLGRVSKLLSLQHSKLKSLFEKQSKKPADFWELVSNPPVSEATSVETKSLSTLHIKAGPGVDFSYSGPSENVVAFLELCQNLQPMNPGSYAIDAKGSSC